MKRTTWRAAKPRCCEHAVITVKFVEDVQHCTCRACGHSWQTWPL